jgi:4-amino-4-deoxy-L-arabinose transferase-like glycosyltransferase
MHSSHATTVEAGLADGDQRTGERDPILLERSKLLDRAKPHTRSLAWIVVFCVAYILPGLTGHDPWKSDEAYIFGSVYHMVQTGDWVVPYVAGEPFMEKPPLFQAVAATLAKLASPMLPLHHGARLASGLFVTFTLLALWVANSQSSGNWRLKQTAAMLPPSVTIKRGSSR